MTIRQRYIEAVGHAVINDQLAKAPAEMRKYIVSLEAKAEKLELEKVKSIEGAQKLLEVAE